METYNIETVQYKGYTITINDDPGASEFMFDDLKDGADGSLLVLDGGRDYISFGITEAEQFLAGKLRGPRAMYNKLPEEARQYMADRAKDYEESITAYWSGCGIHEYMEALEYFSDVYLERLEALATACGIRTHAFTVRGYCQGEAADLLLIDNGEEWSNWKTGEWRGYQDYVEKCFFGGFCSYYVEETGDACGGYQEPADAIEEAKACVDADIEEKRKAREKKTRAYVSHNVPLLKRV